MAEGEGEPVREIGYQDFLAVEMRVGTVLSCRPNPKARRPAYVLEVDFGALGTRLSSAQVTEAYSPEDLVGTQVVAVMNFPPLRVAGVKSEVLVLGVMAEGEPTLLVRPTGVVRDGARVL